MPKNSVKAIIFDLGNVVIDFDHNIAARKICGFTKTSPSQIYQLFFDSGITELFEEGNIAPREFFLKIKELLSLSIDYELFLPIWNEIFFFTQRNRQVVELAVCLRNSYRLGLLSNINVLHYEYIKNNFPVFEAFHHVMTSFELGKRKPHPVIYQKALEILGVDASQVYYTDDRPELIAAARAMGICGSVFTDTATLKNELINNGIMVS